MMITLLVFLFGLQQRANCITAQKDSKDIQLVDLIKKDLRRNNDDYIDKFNISKVDKVAINKQSGADNVAKTNAKEQLADNDALKKPNHMFLGKGENRRLIDFSDEIDYNKYSFSPVTVTTDPSVTLPSINPKRYQKVTDKTDRASVNGYPEYVKKDSVDQFEQFMSKNKDLIRDFLNKKRGEADEGDTTEPMPSLRVGLDDDEDTDRKTKSSEERRGVMPGPRQLDMAPAKGGRIHSMRIKGRLCQRNVLVPEGPKYDSKGHIYLAAFKRGRYDYPETKPPKIVLPKCCNCCRKSVLGCE